MIELADILRGAGLPVVETPGWRTRTHAGTLAPIGGIWHHTGALNDLDVVINGREDLAGPLANLFHAKDGTWFVVCGNVAWHAGDGRQDVLDRVSQGLPPVGDAPKPDTRKGVNHLFVGIESEGGVLDHDDFTDAEIESLLAGTAALCRALGLSANQWIHHREWTHRKVDMAYRGDMRGRLGQLLGAAPRTANPTPSSVTDVDPADPPAPAAPEPPPEEVMYVVIEAPDRSPAFYTPDGQGHAMGRGGWTFINRFATKHPNLVVFDNTWTTEEYDLVTRLPAHSVDEPIDPGQLPPGVDDPFGGLGGMGDGDVGGTGDGDGLGAGGTSDGGLGGDITLPPDLVALPDDIPEPSVGTFG